MIRFNFNFLKKLRNRFEKLLKFGIKGSKLGIGYTKSCELKTQFDRHFDSKSERFLLDSMDLLRICFDM